MGLSLSVKTRFFREPALGEGGQYALVPDQMGSQIRAHKMCQAMRRQPPGQVHFGCGPLGRVPLEQGGRVFQGFRHWPSPKCFLDLLAERARAFLAHALAFQGWCFPI